MRSQSLVGAGNIVGSAALIGKGVSGIVAVDLVLDDGAFQHLLEIVDRRRRAPIVLVGEVPLESYSDLWPGTAKSWAECRKSRRRH